MQGSGTFSVEAAVNTLVPRDGHVLVLINGAYGTRLARLTRMMGRRLSTFETADDVPTTPQDVDRLLAADPSITHVGLIHCETSTGILNPLPEIAAVVARHGKTPHRRRDELVRGDRHRRAQRAVRRADRGVGQVRRGSAGHGLRLRPPRGAGAMRRQLDLALPRSLRPVDVHGEDDAVALHAADAHRRRVQRRARSAAWRKAGSRPGSRATRRTARCWCAAWPSLAFARSSQPEIQAPIIVTFHAPADPRYTFNAFYDCVRDKGFVLYPGKLTQVETFRVGCIGAIGPDEMRHAVNAVRDTLSEMGIRQVSPAPTRAAA